MRKILLVLFLLLPFSLLAQKAERKMNRILDELYIGMSTKEFKSIAKKSTLVEMRGSYRCYKLTKSNAKIGEPRGYVYSTRFFYFKDDKLYRIDEGVRATDLKVEIEKDIHNYHHD